MQSRTKRDALSLSSLNKKLFMNKLLIFLIMLFGLLNPIMAQPTLNDSTEVYDYWTMRGVTEMIYAYMDDYIEEVGSKKSINEITRKKDYEIEFIKKLDNDELPKLESLSLFLEKHNWMEIQKNILLPLVNKIESRTKLNYAFFELSKSNIENLQVSTGSKWESKKEEIIENYQRDLTQLSSNVNVSNMNMFEYIEETALAVNGKEILVNIFMLLLGLVIGVWLVYSYSKRKIYTILDEERVYYLDYPPLKTEKSIFHYITLFHVLKRRKDSYKRHNKDLKKRIDELEIENLSLKEKSPKQ